MESTWGGLTWSYQPPQSSQAMKIAVESQKGLAPMALVTEATQSGPSAVNTGPAWSE